ncbi:MAG: tRNA (guanosine(37)-N1)-methyltransferase TrmD [Actinomycetota bacterium]|jgi:tRNA (guanine37-N1)-methyltransferase|nr:tRNA (guanosine(37)-N1)-methyltransferase TrmD [Acidimicrobiaceae bacterium]MEC7914769.1 tRNA (guanosine(37)-N1)-methyltransferase TrmD [Actinomycetota bacterium]MEC9059943.1 tRNA (guanosine(37)-N1)-methyltransferase TrmD [Actinomycetota bacterium]MEC9473894.1 tRNA (guanosine(37)-N1)-methyltransferase TrmD [Actinomycetota bacterium]MED5362410.1 tRNA (guanosine(37)-N1)-methyltransferase TrmD [Actinomycetota bacterium]|tara:strand:+ start:52 stop:795 length:744 start_codon:yes stop_codon:yes gene_type:complete
MRIDVFTIFPQIVSDMGVLSILGRAQKEQVLDLRVHDLRMTATDPHRTVDDKPFGGGPGMIMKPEPVFGAVDAIDPPRPIVLMDPGGTRFDQAKANQLAGLDGFSLLCGRYEGVDERIRTNLVDEELSIGDFVLAGGEFAAMVVIEAVVRLVPGVLGNEVSTKDESFGDYLLEYPQWTRPSEFQGLTVPETLRSGNHPRVSQWRLAMAIARTARLRPDLLEQRGVSREELALLDEFNISIADRFVSE